MSSTEGVETSSSNSGSNRGQPSSQGQTESDRFPNMARIARITGGFALVIAGIFMLVLPGPGIVTIVGGLVLLSRDVPWAGRLADWTKERFSSLIERDSAESSGETDAA